VGGDNYGAARDREEEGGEKARLGMVTLEEPLKPDKLCYNLTVGIGPRTSSVGTCCVACCWGLTVFLRLLLQYGTRVLYPLNPLYLAKAPPGASRAFCARTAIAETLNYLNPQGLRLSQPVSPSPTRPPNLHQTPFLEYPSLY